MAVEFPKIAVHGLSINNKQRKTYVSTNTL